MINENQTRAGKTFELAIIFAIISSVVVVLFDMDPGMERWTEVLYTLEWFFTILFTAEYLLRLWTVSSPIKYSRSFFGVIDLLAIIPAYISLIPGVEIEYMLLLRVLRLLRIVRVFKLISASNSIHSIIVVTFALLFGAFAWHFLRVPNPNILIFATGSEGGMYNRLAKQLKIAIEKEHQDLRIVLKKSDGSNDNIKAIEQGTAQIAFVQNDALAGDNVRSLASIYPELLHLVSNTGSKIENLMDLSEKDVAIGAPGSGTRQIVKKLLEFCNVSINEIQPVSFNETLKKLENGELDAAFFLTGIGSPSIHSALKNPKLTLTDIKIDNSEDEVELITSRFSDGFRVHYPHAEPKIIPQMAYMGRPDKPVPSIGVQAVLVCEKGIDQEIISRITNTLFTQRAILSQKESAFSLIDESKAQANLQFPLHIGAENFYLRKEPGFFVENAEAMGFILTLVLLLWSGLSWIFNWYSIKKKNRIDKFYIAVDEVIHQLVDCKDLEKLNKLEDRLLEIRRSAADDLVEEKISANESFIIYQNMLNGCQAMLVRMRTKIEKN